MKPRARCCTCNHQHDDGDDDVDDHSSSVGAWLTCEVRPVPRTASFLSHTSQDARASRDGFMTEKMMDDLLPTISVAKIIK
jgi:hypothetical protein